MHMGTFGGKRGEAESIFLGKWKLLFRCSECLAGLSQGDLSLRCYWLLPWGWNLPIECTHRKSDVVEAALRWCWLFCPGLEVRTSEASWPKTDVLQNLTSSQICRWETLIPCQSCFEMGAVWWDLYTSIYIRELIFGHNFIFLRCNCSLTTP